jgi:tetratricopeptide (TPR) repeat protein
MGQSGGVNISRTIGTVSGDIVGGNKGLDEESVRWVLQEELARISGEKGVPRAPLQAVLAKLGDKGVRYKDIPTRLEAAADELVRFRAENDLLKQGPPEIAALAGEAQALIDEGEFDGARAALHRGRDAARKLRDESSRYEAHLLVQEARVDHLQLAYRSAAEKYAEAASLVASFDAESHRKWRFAQANECLAHGTQFGDSAALAKAIALYRQYLSLFPRDRVPLDWAATQNNLANALETLGRREGGTQRLEEAVSAYRAALEEYTRDRVPLDWAMTQINLGDALQRLGKREGGTQRLEEAVSAYRTALEEYTREASPRGHDIAQLNLATCLTLFEQRRASSQESIFWRIVHGLSFLTGQRREP